MIEPYKAKFFTLKPLCAKLAEVQRCGGLYLKVLVGDLAL